MKVIWLGQAGLLIYTAGKTILVDPYLSDSVARVEPQNTRRQPIDNSIFDIRPDYIVITHAHGDHLDKDTLDIFFKRYSGMTVLASYNAWREVRTYGGDNNYIMFDEGTTWSDEGIVFKAVHAEHSDDKAIGVMLKSEGKIQYITGDTLYSDKVLASLPECDIDVLYLPINGRGNNMNMLDAKCFARYIGAKHVVPVHFGMFDDIDPTAFDCHNAIVPKIYEEIVFEK